MSKSLYTSIFLALLFATTASAQFSCYCCDGTTIIAAVHHVYRTSGNNVDALIGTQVTGDYWYDWETYVSGSETVGSTTLHSGADSVGYGGNDQILAGGTAAGIRWDDAPSSTGAGTYSLSGYHEADSSCGDYTSTSSSSSSVVNKPTITQSNAGTIDPQTLWNFGAGTANSIPTSYGYTYLQSITLGLNTNCNPSDTCNDTPQWSISSPASQISLSPLSGTSVTLSKGSAIGHCQYDTTVSVNLGGFSSDSTLFIVNSPTSAVARTGFVTDDLSPGYQSVVKWSVNDACPTHNFLTSLPWYEAFGTLSSPGVVSGWNTPLNPGGYSVFNDPDDLSTFDDFIAAHDPFHTWVPFPTYTASNPPFTYYTVIMQAPHSYYVGAAGFTGGTQIFSGNIYYFQDHGATY